MDYLEENELSNIILGCAIEVHKQPGPGLEVHTAQVLTYLGLGNYKLGLLLNFHVTTLKNGIKRVIN
jgi:hypothetical protein